MFFNVEQIWDEPVPGRIYKYTRRKYAEVLCNYGRLRLRGLESYDSDPDEGRQIAFADEVTFAEFHERSQAGQNIRAKMAGLVDLGPAASRSTITNCLFERRLGNLMVFCASTKLSHETMQQCNNAPGVGGETYDSCVEITDVNGFIAAMMNVLTARSIVAQCCIAGNVKYWRREHPIRETVHARDFEPAFVKPAVYEEEAEYRLVWPLVLEPGAFLDFECPTIPQFCKLCEPAVLR